MRLWWRFPAISAIYCFNVICFRDVFFFEPLEFLTQHALLVLPLPSTVGELTNAMKEVVAKSCFRQRKLLRWVRGYQDGSYEFDGL